MHKHVFVLSLVLCVRTAYAATCPAAGYYLDDSDMCTLCELGHYCPGNNKMYNCTDRNTTGENGVPSAPYYSDERGLSACKKCPEITDPTILPPTRYWYYAADQNSPEAYIHTVVTNCRAEWSGVVRPRGTYKFHCSYGTINSYIDSNSASKCIASIKENKCIAGYWMSTGSYTRSSTNVFFSSYYDATNDLLCTPVGRGYYSTGTNVDRVQCPAGTYSRTDVATSADECDALCGAGVTKLKTSTGLSFNIYQMKLTSPALAVGSDNGVCYIPLAGGNASNAINVQYDDGKIYHTTD